MNQRPEKNQEKITSSRLRVKAVVALELALANMVRLLLHGFT